MTDPPGAECLPRRIRGLRDDVGYFERVGDHRTEPVRGLMVEMVGKPQLWCGFRHIPAALDKMFGEPTPKRGEPGLMVRIAISFETAKARGEHRLMPGELESCEEKLRDPAISRGNGMIGRLQRCVEGDPHAVECRALASPGSVREEQEWVGRVDGRGRASLFGYQRKIVQSAARAHRYPIPYRKRCAHGVRRRRPA